MNIILLNDNQIKNLNEFEISGRIFRHLHDVLHAKPGDKYKAGIFNGQYGTLEILSMTSDSCIWKYTEEPELKIITNNNNQNIDLILAMPRPKELKRIIKGK